MTNETTEQIEADVSARYIEFTHGKLGIVREIIKCKQHEVCIDMFGGRVLTSGSHSLFASPERLASVKEETEYKENPCIRQG